MSFGEMRECIKIIDTCTSVDEDGFAMTTEIVLANVRAYREGRHGTEKWRNLSTFSEATDLFRFRVIPSLNLNTDYTIECDGIRYEIVSVENIRGKGMYLEVLAKKVEATGGKSND